jgi:hypothetical protein
MRKICYTVITGGYDTVQEPRVVTPGWEYHLWHDNSVDIPKDSVWQPMEIPNEDNLPPHLLARTIKAVCPYRGKLITCYVDGTCRIDGNLDEVIDTFPEDWRIAAGAHPLRNCAYEEALEVIRLRKAPGLNVVEVMSYLILHGWKHGKGLWQCCVLFRNYENNRGWLRGSEYQWDELIQRLCHRDQISFPYAFDGKVHSIRPDMLWRFNHGGHV